MHADGLAQGIAHTGTPLQLKYELHLGGEPREVVLPFSILVLSDLVGAPDDPPPPVADRKLLVIDRDNFDARMRALRPRVTFDVEDGSSLTAPSSRVDLTFERLDDFHPDGVARKVEPLRRLLDRRSRLAELRDRLRAKGGVAAPLAHRGPEALVDAVGGAPPPSEPESMAPWIVDQIAECDRTLSGHLTGILGHPDFRQLEAAWRGLRFIVDRVEGLPGVKCYCMNVTRDELASDLCRSPGLTRSIIFQNVHAEYTTYGGEPFSVIVADHALHHGDVLLLDALGRLATRLNAVVIAAAAPALLNLDSFADLPLPRDLAKIHTSLEYEAWRLLRRSEFARRVVVTLPRVLARAPYLLQDAGGALFNFEETTGADARDYVWTSAAFVLAERIAATFSRTGWFDAFLGVDGGLVDGLPVHTFQAAEGDAVTFCPAEVPIPERREQELVRLGLAPLVHCSGTDYAVFFDAPPLHRPESSSGWEPRERAGLPATLALNRLVQFLRTIIRDRHHEASSIESLNRLLNDWLAQYVAREPMDPSSPGRFPFRSARVAIVRMPGGLGGPVLRVTVEPILTSAPDVGELTEWVDLSLDDIPAM